jgi:hypothetical protein
VQRLHELLSLPRDTGYETYLSGPAPLELQVGGVEVP